MRVRVRVYPGSKRAHVGGRYGDGDPPALIVRVQAPAVDGRANQAVVAAIANAFGVATRHVRLVSGATSRSKVIEIDDADLTRWEALLANEP